MFSFVHDGKKAMHPWVQRIYAVLGGSVGGRVLGHVQTPVLSCLCFQRGNLNHYTKRPVQDSAIIFSTPRMLGLCVSLRKSQCFLQMSATPRVFSTPDVGICVSLRKSQGFLHMSATPRVENPQIFPLENAICCIS